jgi:hypothetical protein
LHSDERCGDISQTGHGQAYDMTEAELWKIPQAVAERYLRDRCRECGVARGQNLHVAAAE